MSSWHTAALHKVATIERDVVEAARIEDATAYVGLENIESGGKLIGVREVDSGELASSKFNFTARHLLYGKLRPYLAKIARPEFEGICSTDILPVLPGPELDRNYLAHFLLQPSMVAFANSRAAGANLPRLSPRTLAEFQIPMPPLAEQRRIAEVLDRADALRAKRRAALVQLDSLTQSIFLDVLLASEDRQPVPLSMIAESNRGSFVNGPFGSDLLTNELTVQGVPVIYIRDIRDGEYRRVSTSCVTPEKARRLAVCSVRPGDVLIAKVGDPPGTAATYPRGAEPAIITQDVVRIRVDTSRFVPEFIVGYLNSELGQQKVAEITVQATRARFSLKDFKQLMFEIPSLPIQRRFADRIVVIEKLKAAQRAALTELDALFASLQHREFRGEL